MSYQGSVYGELFVYCNTPEEVAPVIEYLKEHEKLKRWEHGFEIFAPTQIELMFSGEIRYYFRDDLEAVAHDLLVKFPGVYMQGALEMFAENDIPYRLEMNKDGSTKCSDEIDWLLNYSCADIERIQRWAKKNCKEVGI
jgi:hypothetical protein